MKHLSIYLATCLIGGMTVVSSCTDDKDYYDPTWGQTQAEESYANSFDSILGSVNAGQNWTTVKILNAKITANLGLSDSYTVAVYNSNPLTAGASLLAIGVVNDGQTTNLYFDAPASQDHFFVGIYDSLGDVLVENAGLTDGILAVSFNSPVSSKAPRRATEEEAATYARTAADFLTPVIENVTVNSLTEADMQTYPAITDSIIVNETNNRTLSNQIWSTLPPTYVAGGDGKHYRVDADTEITELFHINGDMAIVNDAVIYIQGRVHLMGNTLNGVTLVVADGGEIVLDSEENHFSTTGRLVVLAGGKVSGDISGAAINLNNGQWSYNAGEIDFDGTLNLNGSTFYNCGTVDVDVITGTSGGSVFTNFGRITARTNRQQADSYNCQYVNACYLHFTEDAALGSITMLNNSRVDIDRDAFFNGDNQMGNASAIVVGRQTTLQTNTVFNGPTGNGTFAVFKPNKVLVSWIGDGDFNNNIYVDWVDTECYDGNGNQYDMTNQWSGGFLFLNKIEHWVVEETAPAFISIEAGECTGAGYNVPDDDPTEPTPVTPPAGPVYYTIAFENLGSTDDFDFNDIVLYVAHDVQTNKATVQLMAAGGTLPVQVKYNDATIITKSDGVMTNTSATGGFKGVIASVSDLDFTDAILDLRKFSIEVDYSGVSIVVSSSNIKGRAPQALIVPGKWKWPSERTRITEAYPYFAEWIEGINDNGWYTAPEAAKVITAE